MRKTRLTRWLAMLLCTAMLVGQMTPGFADTATKSEASAQENKTEDPAQENKTEAPVEEVKTEEPVEEEKTEDPAEEDKTEEPVEEEKTEDPAEEDKTEAPAEDDKTEDPAEENKTETPAEEENTEDPAEEENTEDPAEEENTEDPAEEDKTEDPVEEEKTEDPVADDKTVEPGAALTAAAASAEAVAVLSLDAQSTEEECAHPNAERQTTSNEYDVIEGSYTDTKDGKHHTYQTRQYSYINCPDCGLIEYKEIEPVTRTEAHSFSESECYVCHAKNVCEHANTTSQSYNSIDQNSYECVDETTHKYTALSTTRWDCTDCGETWYIRGNDIEGTANHAFVDGVCVCGAKSTTTCTHQNKTVSSTSYGVDDEVYTCTDDKTHHFTRSYYADWTCSDCDETGTQLVKTETVEQAHNFYEGVCIECKKENTCDHPNGQEVDSWVPVDDSQIKSDGQGHHTYKGEKVYYLYCPDCGDYFETYTGEINDAYTEDCTYLHGKCQYCGFANPCEHEYSVIKETNSLDLENPYYNITDETHSYKATVTQYIRCAKCRDSMSVDLEGLREITVPHTYYDGVCVCGAKSGCAHENGWTRVSERIFAKDIPNYADQGDGTHSFSCEIVYYDECNDCGERKYVSSTESARYNEAHSFVDGVCVCGAQEPEQTACTHEDTWQMSRDIPKGTATDLGNGYHTLTVDIQIETYCSDCGASWEEPYKTDVQRTESHYDNDGDGKCDACGAAYQGCSHPEPLIVTIYRPMENPNYQDKGDGTHSYSARKTVRTVCELCLRTIEETTEDNVTDIKKHYFVSDGAGGSQCECGAKNTCTHEEADTNRYENINHIYQPEDLGNGTHKYYVTVEDHKYCPTCGLSETTVVKEADERTQKHSFYNGVCTQCGATNECTHANAVKREQEASQLASVDNGDGTHTYLANMQLYWSCPDCGEMELEPLDETVSVTEGHTFQQGRCFSCGAIKPCEHANVTVSTHRESSANGLGATDNGDGTHSVLVNLYQQWQCQNCSEYKRMVLGTDVMVSEPHTYKNGVCTECGAQRGCAHEHTVDCVEESIYEMVASNGDGTHTGVGTRRHFTKCLDCGEELKETSVKENVQITDSCYYEDGVCWCGAKNTCQHPNAQTMERYSAVFGAKLTDNGNGTHTGLFNRVVTTWCPSCEMQTDKIVEANVEHTQEHDFYDDGVCGCGAVSTCKHENATVEDVYFHLTDAPYTDNGDGTHTCLTRHVKLWSCPDCRVQEGTVVEYRVEHTEPHVFEGGKCIACNAPQATGGTTGGGSTGSTGSTGTTGGGDSGSSSGGSSSGGSSSSGTSSSGSSSGSSSSSSGTSSSGTSSSGTSSATTTVTAAGSVAQPTGMVGTLLTAVSDAQAEDRRATVDIVGADEVFTQEEYEQLKTLTVQEQVMVTLASIGYADEVQAAVRSGSVVLSAEAVTLMSSVSVRMGEATAQERAELEAILAQYFPVEEIVMDGVSYPFFIIELRIVKNGVTTLERYGFRFDSYGQWVFMQLDITTLE